MSPLARRGPVTREQAGSPLHKEHRPYCGVGILPVIVNPEV